jgi:hypothetical protein
MTIQEIGKRPQMTTKTPENFYGDLSGNSFS